MSNVMKSTVVPLVLVILASLLACSNRTGSSAGTSVTQNQNQNQLQSAKDIKLTSTAFKEGESIPHQYTCDGVNVSPPLEWSGVPKSAKTVAMIADDPDAPSGTWVHWILYNLPAENIGMVENLPTGENLKAGGLQGKNDFGNVGYGGPCPPSGTHRYFFKIYALDGELPLKAGATKPEVEKAMEGHVMAQGQLMGTYRR